MELLTKIIIEGTNLGGESGKDELGNYYIKYFLDNDKEKATIIIYPKEKINKNREAE
jgi:hypothetical protein